MIARLALFFAIAGWAVASLRVLEVNTNLFLLNIDRAGYSILYGAEPGHFAYDLVAIAESMNDMMVGHRTESESWFGPSTGFEHSISFLGVHSGNVGAFYVMHFRHWLVVSVFALFYGLLRYVYRKRATPVSV